MNQHPLTADYRMYLHDTYVFAFIDGELQTMCVSDTRRTGDDRTMEGFEVMGSVYNRDGRIGEDWAQWPANILEAFRPISGYYDLTGRGQRNRYITFVVNNRTQRKGVDIRNVMVHGRQRGCHPNELVRIWEQSRDMPSRPGHRDFYQEASGKLHWKGSHIGRIEGENFIAEPDFEKYKDLVCRLLQSI